ncbi:MAG: hypothetical protein O9972_22550 [Burkholderiales bacterium]|jgi:hypothetical protein|nr:hypothetical protein [Burkholderiales bacterium]
MTTPSLRVAELSVIALETSFAAAITIAARTPMLVNGARSARERDEAHRMVVEKVEAVIECVGAAQIATMIMWTRIAFGDIRGPNGLAMGFVDIATAAARPVRARVQANANRLVGGG